MSANGCGRCGWRLCGMKFRLGQPSTRCRRVCRGRIMKHVRKAVAEAVGEEEAGALTSDEAIRVSGLSQGGWGSRKRGRLALGKVRAAAAAPVPPAAASGVADPRARRAARGAAAAGMLPRVSSRSTSANGLLCRPSGATTGAPPADPRARKRARRSSRRRLRWTVGWGRGFAAAADDGSQEARATRDANGDVARGRGGGGQRVRRDGRPSESAPAPSSILAASPRRRVGVPTRQLADEAGKIAKATRPRKLATRPRKL